MAGDEPTFSTPPVNGDDDVSWLMAGANLVYSAHGEKEKPII